MGINVCLELCNDTHEETREDLEKVLEVLVENNAAWFANHPEAPCCLSCHRGIRYRPPKRKQMSQTFYCAGAVLARREASCESIAAYDAGHLLYTGQFARVVLLSNDLNDFHAVIQLSDGSLFDPTEKLLAVQRGDSESCPCPCQ